MTEITEAGFLAYLILGSALLVMIATFIPIVEERRAFKTFRRCADAARDAGIEKEFMNNIFSYGDSVSFVIRSKGAREIKRVYERTVKQYK